MSVAFYPRTWSLLSANYQRYRDIICLFWLLVREITVCSLMSMDGLASGYSELVYTSVCAGQEGGVAGY